MIASRRLYILLGLALLPLAAAYWWPPGRAVGLMADLIIFCLLLVDWQSTQSVRHLSASRSTASRLSIGKTNKVELVIVNRGSQNLPLRVRDDYPRQIGASVAEFAFNLAAGCQARLEYLLTPARRGEYNFSNINIRYLSRLGLFWRQASIAAPQAVRVFPDLEALRELSVKLSRSSELGELTLKRRGQGTDFASLREYTLGDDTRAIDWKATARRDSPVVRTYEAEQEQTLLILVDAGRMMVSDLEGLTRFDHALNAALCLALAGLSKNDQVALGIFADRPIVYLPPRRGKAYLTTMLEAVHNIEPLMVEPDYTGVLSYFASASKGRSLMVVLTDLTDALASQNLLAGLASLSPRHLPFCVTLADRQLTRVALQQNHDLETIYRRAVATELISQRELALSHLVRRGCLTLDCPPQDLSCRLIEQYLEIKAKGVL